VDKLEQLRAPRRREGELVTEAFERGAPDDGRRGGGGAQDDPQGVSVRRVAEITLALLRVEAGTGRPHSVPSYVSREQLGRWGKRIADQSVPGTSKGPCLPAQVSEGDDSFSVTFFLVPAGTARRPSPRP